MDSAVGTGVSNKTFMEAARGASHRFYRDTQGFSVISLVLGLGLGLLVLELCIYCLNLSCRQWKTTRETLFNSRNTRTVFLSLRQDLQAAQYTQGATAENPPQTLNASFRSRLLPGSDIITLGDTLSRQKVLYFVARSKCDAKPYTLWRWTEGQQKSMELLHGMVAFNLRYKLFSADVCGGKYRTTNEMGAKDWPKVCRLCATWQHEAKAQPFIIEIEVGHAL